MTQQFDNPISEETAYRLICLYDADSGARNAVSARGWLKHSSWYHDRVELTDGSYIYRESYDGLGQLYHSNVTTADVLDMFDIDWRALGISSSEDSDNA